MTGRVVYIEHAKAVRRYLHAIDRREDIESSAAWRRSPRYLEFVEVAETLVMRSREELRQIREELKKSQNLYDKVYYYTIVEKQKAEYIAKMTGYSRRQICRYQRQIEEKIKESVSE